MWSDFDRNNILQEQGQGQETQTGHLLQEMPRKYLTRVRHVHPHAKNCRNKVVKFDRSVFGVTHASQPGVCEDTVW